MKKHLLYLCLLGILVIVPWGIVVTDAAVRGVSPGIQLGDSPTLTGDWTFSPTSGRAITLTAASGNQGVNITGANNSYAVAVVGGATAGQSYGAEILAGTNASDTSFLVANKGNTANFLQLIGDGHGALGYNGTANTFSWNAAGNVTVAAPSSGTALTVTGVSGQLAFAPSQPVGLPTFTVATLPTCNGTLRGGMAYVTDATSPAYNAALTGGGAVVVPVFCNAASWTSH